jgi:hypothetical protein
VRPIVLSLCFALAAPCGAAEPSLDADLAKLKEMRAKASEAAKAVEAFEADLRKRIAELQRLYPDLFGPAVPPVPPKPFDPLKVKLAAAFEADAAAGKKDSAKDLAALYRAAAKLCTSADVATAGELLARVKKAAATMLDPPDALKGVRAAVGAELGAMFPADGPLSDEQRVKAAELFGKLAVILDALGA